MTSAGFLNIFKPPGMTSHDVVYYLRKSLNLKKMGHGGTLDPVACGVLVCLVNKATRLSQKVSSTPKTYRAVATFGIRTDTGDVEGRVIEEKDVRLTAEDVAGALAGFTGEIVQRPPMTSAVKVGGKRLYKLARKGIEVERPPRQVTVHELKMCSFEGGERPRALLEINCSSGTYVRSLVEDIGAALDAPAVTSFLVRTAVGPFSIEDAVAPGEITPAEAEKYLVDPAVLEEFRA